jgi:hypothetical protein
VKQRYAWAAVAVLCALASVAIDADTLVLRDGRRVDGQLVAVRDGVIEFEARRGIFGRDRLRLSQNEVARIEFEEYDRPSSGGGGNDNNGGGRPSGMRERAVSVDARSAWSDTGVTVRAGQQIFVEASGRVRWGPGRQDGPDGENNSPRNENRPMPTRPAAALIGRIDDNVFFIGDERGPIRVRDSGRLYLGINDDFLQDNSGAFRVTVYY